MIQTSPTLGDLLRIVAAKLTLEGVGMPLHNEGLWQRVFYSLKKEFASKYELLRELRFDWDGPAPRSKELAEYLQALHWTGNVSGTNPSWDKMTLSDDVAREWLQEVDSMSADLQELTEIASERARQAFPA